MQNATWTEPPYFLCLLGDGWIIICIPRMSCLQFYVLHPRYIQSTLDPGQLRLQKPYSRYDGHFFAFCLRECCSLQRLYRSYSRPSWHDPHAESPDKEGLSFPKGSMTCLERFVEHGFHYFQVVYQKVGGLQSCCSMPEYGTLCYSETWRVVASSSGLKTPPSTSPGRGSEFR